MVKKIFTIAIYSIRQWKADLRILLLFLCMVMFIWNDLSVVSSFASRMDMNTNPVYFPFYSSDIIKQLILLAGIIFLFSNVPFINKNQPYVIIRSKRLFWVLGQILYIIMASGIYYITLIGASIIVLLPNITFATDGWGKIINTLAQTNTGELIKLQFGISEKIVTSYSPFQALGLSFLLNWGMASFMGLLMFAFSLKFNRKIGLFAGSMLLFFDLLVINGLPYKFYCLSPVTFSRLAMLDPTGVSMLPKLTYPFIFFGIGIILLSVISVVSIRNKPIKITPET